jgi:hypothetical protein
MREESPVSFVGKLEEDPYGTWSDVDRGYFIDGDSVRSMLRPFKNKKIRLIIEEVDE